MVVSQRVHGKHFVGKIGEVFIIAMNRHDPCTMLFCVGDPLKQLGGMRAR
jgi:hypothetical protein